MLCLTAHTLIAASEPITGTVVDEVGSPLEFANVTLLTLNDSILVDGTVTDAAGKFSVTDSTNPCFLRISAMGYEETKITNPHGNLGSIQLTPASYELGEVVVPDSIMILHIVLPPATVHRSRQDFSTPFLKMNSNIMAPIINTIVNICLAHIIPGHWANGN